jgi:putative transposase
MKEHRILILRRRHLHNGERAPSRHYNGHRPHRSLGQRTPLRTTSPTGKPTGEVIDLDRVRRRDLLGGLIHEYRLAA